MASKADRKREVHADFIDSRESGLLGLAIGFFAACYLAVLPMADTIALRNVALLGLSFCLLWDMVKTPRIMRWQPPFVLVLWPVFLLLFPLVSGDPSTAFENLFGQWGRSVWAMLVGAGVALVLLPRDKGSAFSVGIVSSVPVLVYLGFFGWKAIATSSIPWGYWGRETHHADIGYAAGQSAILLSAAIAAGVKRIRPWSLLLLGAAVLSTVLARSRGGLAFSVAGVLLVVMAVALIRTGGRRWRLVLPLIGILVASGATFFVATKDDNRWRNMAPQIVAGFLGDAIQIQCEGTASVEARIIAEYGNGDQASKIIYSIKDGDGSRMVVLRAGLALALKHPWGIDGSRQSFQKVLKQECANPAISMAHTHNGWLDTMLALGWLGATLYFLVLSYFLVQSVLILRQPGILNEWALVLFALATFWIFRGSADSVFRDHMLEMQGFVLAFAYVQAKSGARNQNAPVSKIAV